MFPVPSLPWDTLHMTWREREESKKKRERNPTELNKRLFTECRGNFWKQERKPSSQVKEANLLLLSTHLPKANHLLGCKGGLESLPHPPTHNTHTHTQLWEVSHSLPRPGCLVLSTTDERAERSVIFLSLQLKNWSKCTRAHRGVMSSCGQGPRLTQICLQRAACTRTCRGHIPQEHFLNEQLPQCPREGPLRPGVLELWLASSYWNEWTEASCSNLRQKCNATEPKLIEIQMALEELTFLRKLSQK